MYNKLYLSLTFLLHLTLTAEVHFQKIVLSSQYISEGASIGDINTDGHLDLIAGPLWWQGPDFKASHAYAPVQAFPIKGPKLTGYSNNFFTFPEKITKDKWPDILKVGKPGKPAHLAINPGEKPLTHTNTSNQCEHCLAQQNICNESPQFLNILPGETKQLLAFSKNYITLSQPSSNPTKPWQVFNISPKNKRFKTYSHGLGSADINSDGLPDILEKEGWWQQPKNWNQKTPWTYAHAYGLAWYENTQSPQTGITFKQHIIMPKAASDKTLSFSQLHAMACADIDGDGIKDIITGKCYFAHNGRDPGALDPPVLYWFRTTRTENGTTFTPHLIDDNSGVGRQISTADFNKDGKVDIASSNKKGTFIFLQTHKSP